MKRGITGSQIHDGVLSYENEVFASVFDSRSSDVEDSPVTDRFVKVKGMHAVPPPMTGNYMPPKSDFGIDESKFTVEPLESVPKPVANEPKVWFDAPIIEEYESNNDDEHVTLPSKEQDKPSFSFVNNVEHLKTPSFSHLIRDCDFHEKRMAKQIELTKQQVSAVEGKWETAVKASTGCNWRCKRHYWNRVSKYNSRFKSRECVDIKDPLGRLKKQIRLKRDKSEQKRTKPDKNGKRVEAGKSLKQLQ
nr:hypothetical protein [Tanacetum cinerariifolium]